MVVDVLEDRPHHRQQDERVHADGVEDEEGEQIPTVRDVLRFACSGSLVMCASSEAPSHHLFKPCSLSPYSIRNPFESLHLKTLFNCLEHLELLFLGVFSCSDVLLHGPSAHVVMLFSSVVTVITRVWQCGQRMRTGTNSIFTFRPGAGWLSCVGGRLEEYLACVRAL